MKTGAIKPKLLFQMNCLLKFVISVCVHKMASPLPFLFNKFMLTMTTDNFSDGQLINLNINFY